MEFFKTNKGKEKLYFRGYAYVFHKKNIGDIRWRCYKHESEKVRIKKNNLFFLFIHIFNIKVIVNFLKTTLLY